MPSQFIGATTGVNQATLPSGWQPGDFAVVFAFRNGSTTPPTVPSGWTQHSSDNYSVSGYGTASAVVGFRKLQSGDTSTSVWTNATHLACCVYREMYAIYGAQWVRDYGYYVRFDVLSKVFKWNWFYRAAGVVLSGFSFPDSFSNGSGVQYVRRAILSNINGTIAVYDSAEGGADFNETGDTILSGSTVPLQLTITSELDTGLRLVGGIGGLDEWILIERFFSGGEGVLRNLEYVIRISNEGVVSVTDTALLRLIEEGGLNIDELRSLINLNLGGVRLERSVSVPTVPERMAIIRHLVKKE